jgi:14-3-3 protein epsilon
MWRQKVGLLTSPMANPRDDCLSLIQILDEAGRQQDMVTLMKQVIALDPSLNAEQRNLLSVSYKSLVSDRRTAIRALSALLDHPDTKLSSARIDRVTAIRSNIIAELEAHCVDLIELINASLLTKADDPEARVFYEKIKADYWRYICETREGEERAKYAAQTKQAYERALEIAKNEIPPYKPASLGIMLNYSVFLYEILGQKEQAIDLARRTFEECENSVSNNSERAYEEAVNILHLLRDNLRLWTDVGNA